MPLKREGIEKLFELCAESEMEHDENRIIRIGNVLSTFPVNMIELAQGYDKTAISV